MTRKTSLLTAIAGSLLMAVPAVAQDPMSPPTQTPPAGTPEPSGTLQLQPGTNVRGADGAVLGRLEGVRTNDAGEQELTVRGSDGQVRAVPLGGLRQEGADVAVAWSTAEFQAAPAIAGDADATPGAPPTDAMTPPSTTPMSPSTTPMSPPASDPMTPPTTDPTTPPDGATPAPGEPMT